MTRASAQARRLGALIFAGTVLLPAAAAAHKQAPLREVIIQLDEHGGALLWRMEVRGREVPLLIVAHDLNRDGKITGAESKRLAASLIGKAMRGVSVQLDGVAAQLESIELKLDEIKPRSAVAAVGLVSLGPVPRRPGTYGLRVSLDAGRGELGLQVHALGPWQLTGPLAAPDGRSLRVPGQLSPKTSIDVEAKLDEG